MSMIVNQTGTLIKNKCQIKRTQRNVGVGWRLKISCYNKKILRLDIWQANKKIWFQTHFCQKSFCQNCPIGRNISLTKPQNKILPPNYIRRITNVTNLLLSMV